MPMDKFQTTKKRARVVNSTVVHCSRATFAVNATVLGERMQCLVDTGADVSVLPAHFRRHAFPFDITLMAANGTRIPAHGCISTTVSIPHLRRDFSAKFIVADVSEPILGAEFFDQHQLLVDVHNRRLWDSLTSFHANLTRCNTTTPKVSILSQPNAELLELLVKHAAVFDIQANRPTPDITFCIDNTTVPKPARPYRLSPDKVQAAKREIEREISLGRMQRSQSQYASPFFPVRKPDGSWRFVADYTKLNEVTTKDNYIPPRIDDLLSRIPRGCTFSKLDLQKAFFLIPVNKDDQPKTAVTTPFGLYEYSVMPMGLKNASQTLQRYIDTVLASSTNTIAYCDDILLFTTPEHHLSELDALLHKLHKAGLVVNRQKSCFLAESVKFLGHHLTSTGYLPSDEKIVGLRSFAVPTTIKQLKRFLGMINFYRRFIPHASALQLPLTSLTHKGVPFVWTTTCQEAFDALIQEACNAVQLTYLNIDDRYVLTTDASASAVGATLTSQNGPVGFFSAKLNAAEQNYSTYDRELTAVFKAVKHFEWLLFGTEFTLRVDHKPLLHMFSHASNCDRRRRQLEYLSTYSLATEYLPGRENIAADALSRDKIVDVIEFSTSVFNTSPEHLRELQENDATLSSIPSEANNRQGTVWRDQQNRIVVPQPLRKDIISSVHNLSHPGVRSTLKQIQLSYTWPKMRKDVSTYVQSCASCQSSKITKHTKPPFKHYGSHEKFAAIHLDYVGPLPSIRGKTYLLTIFDRRTRWFFAHPTAHATSEAAVDGLVRWISNFGVPEIMITDRGTHFESKLFHLAAERLGIEKRRVAAYHPSANGAVERQHRRLKEALRARSANASKTWLSDLPLVLLGLNNSVAEDTNCSAAQTVFNRQLNIPNCIFQGEYDIANACPPKRDFTRNYSHVPKELQTCEYVWLRRPTLTSSLHRPYVGPYKVLHRNFTNHTMTLVINHKEEVVTMERVKPTWNTLASISTHAPPLVTKSVRFSDI